MSSTTRAGPGPLEHTRAATARTERAIERLCREGIAASLIVTLHRGNATADKLPVLYDWFRYLDGIGHHARRGSTSSRARAKRSAAKYALTTEENIAAFTGFAELEADPSEPPVRRVHRHARMLQGEDDNTTCVWNACDPYTTRAVRGVEGHGQRSNCGRTNKDGIDFVKSDDRGLRALPRAVPHAAGGTAAATAAGSS